MKFNSQKGFTLIELLVVISIIGLLSTIVLASLNTARSKARDSYRIQSLVQLSTALELYYTDTGSYPVGGWYASCWVAGNWIPISGNYNWSTGYINKQPRDPQEYCIWPWDPNNQNPTATYAYYSDGQRYALVARLETNDRATIQNSNTKWFDGLPLYSYYGWHPRSHAIIKQ